MKRTTLILMTLISISILSCKSDDDSPLSSNNILVGSTWDGQEASFGIYTFSSNTEFRFVDSGEAPVDGTYTFNGTNGVLSEETGFTAPFDVSGNIMSVEHDSHTSVYIKR